MAGDDRDVAMGDGKAKTAVDSLIDNVSELKKTLDSNDSSQETMLEALQNLRGHGELPTKILSVTLIGKSVNRLAKESPDAVKKLAGELVAEWRQMHRKRKAGVAGIGERTMSNLSVLSAESDAPASQLSQAPSQDTLVGDPSQSDIVSNGAEKVPPPELTADMKDKRTPQREKIKEKLKEALVSIDKMEIKEGSLDDTDDMKDPETLADEIEAALWKDIGEKKEVYMSQVRAILFNLKDKTNPQFKFKVLVGFVAVEGFSKLTAVDMASAEKNAVRKKDHEDAMAAIDQDWAMKKGQIRISGMFTCGKCKGTQTTYFQMQTRSSDEPMTTFASCLTCGNRWKFC